MSTPDNASAGNRAQAGDPPWRVGDPQPVVTALAELGLLGGRMLDVGCGSGDHALLAAEFGAVALGIDVSAVAIDQARTKATQRGSAARFRVGDALALGELDESFDVALDSGFFHTLAPARRRRYAASLAMVIRPGGRVYVTTFSDRQLDGSPGPSIDPAEVVAAFDQGWAVEQISPCRSRTNRPGSGFAQTDAFIARIRRVADDARLSPAGRAQAGLAPTVEILAIEPASPDPTLILDARLTPVPVNSLYEGTYTLAFEGWAIPSAGSEPVLIEVRADAAALQTAVANLASPAAAQRHPDPDDAARSGFQLALGTLTLPREFELSVDAVEAAGVGTRTTLGTIRGRRRPLHSGYRPVFDPIMLTTLGRSGSNWLLALLGQSRELAVASPWGQEPRVAHYWVELLLTIADPRSYMAMLVGQPGDPLWWTGARRQGPLPVRAERPELARWLGESTPTQVAAFGQREVDAFYGRLAQSRGGDARRFVEKWSPGPAATLMRELYPDCHEIVLVRDPRDHVCSIEAFNHRRGFRLWGADADGDELWFAHLRRRGEQLLARWQTGGKRTHLLRYEDLIRTPEATLGALLERLGLDSSPATLRRLLVGAAELNPRAQLRHQTSDTVDASIGRWRSEFSPQRRVAAAAAFDDLLVAFGYEPAVPVPPRPSRPRSD